MNRHNEGMDVDRLRLLVEFSRLGSMREVADELGLTTSTVSHQLARLAREAGTALLEPDGRRVRLTPAGRRLVDHAVTIVAAVDTARRDLDPNSRPVGTVRVGGFATAVRHLLLPVIAELATTNPEVQVQIHEYEPMEAFELLQIDELDLALTYDYNLAPARPGSLLQLTRLWSLRWGLGVPTESVRSTATDRGLDVVRTYAAYPWIVNSRNTADEEAVRTLASLAGFTPSIVHKIDSLDLVQDLILSGMGVGLLPTWLTPRNGVRVLPLDDPAVVLRAFAATRKGRTNWSPLRLVLNRLTSSAPPATDPAAPAGSRPSG